jgi:hypothetical protein
MANEELTSLPQLRPWKYKLERVAKGYVRLTIHSDDSDELLSSWKALHKGIIEMGERVERE